MKKLGSPQELAALRESIVSQRDPERLCITVCSGTGCQAYGCEKVTAAFKQEIERQGLSDRVDILTTGCHGFCERGPLVVIRPK
ncbi:MAG: (2Fe-2S) ferredoxin domain-containing protein, partial [Dehalococcoidales bacterium]|nr:(2Fe-2S) ferredoxin domain-containing protein [Dehalococcoidales bacterium]